MDNIVTLWGAVASAASAGDLSDALAPLQAAADASALETDAPLLAELLLAGAEPAVLGVLTASFTRDGAFLRFARAARRPPPAGGPPRAPATLHSSVMIAVDKWPGWGSSGPPRGCGAVRSTPGASRALAPMVAPRARPPARPSKAAQPAHTRGCRGRS